MTWLADAGEMGQFVRSTDWSATGLGAIDTWSPSRKTVVGICLRSPLPSVLFLGPDHRLIYNRHFVGFLPDGEHPTALGTAGRAVRDRMADGAFDFSPVLAADGETVDGTLAMYTGRRSMDDAQELRAAVELFKLGRYRQDPVTQLIEWDAQLKCMWGLAPDAPVDLGVFLSGIHPDDRARVQSALGQSVDPAGDGVCDIEYRVVGVSGGGGSERWVATRGKTVFDQGRVVSFHGVVLDISERKRAEQTNLTLIAELQHRTRNLLAVVDGLAEQTLASCESLGDFSLSFRQRLATLSRVQGLLSRADSASVKVSELVTLELRALGAEPDGARVMVDGPDVALPNRSVQILALGLHELATNAWKHGALGSSDGRLRVSWRVTGAETERRRLSLRWEETGIASRGPSVQSGGRVGLGRTLIEKALPYQLDALTQLEIGDDAVRCDLSIALDPESS